MSDNLDAPGPAGPEAGPHPEGDFPLDFLAESSESKPEATHSAKAASQHPPSEVVTHHPIFPFLMGGAFAALLAVAWVMNMQPAPPPSAPAATAESPAKPAEASAPSSELTALKDELGGLSKQLKELQEKVEALPKPTPAPDLEPIHTKIATLTKSADAAAALPDKVSALDKKVGDVGQSLEKLDDGLATLTSQVAALKDDIKKVSEPKTASAKPATPVPTNTEPVNVNLEGQAMSQAVELFKAGKYKEAGEVFKTVEDNDPKDARVWYYAAMSRGLATADWKGDTEALVKKGVEREKAGTPTVAEIDSEFAKLPASVKPWLDFYRKTAK